MNTRIAEILNLSVAEKIQIVEDIWDSIGAKPEELNLSGTEKKELDARLENYQQDSGAENSWETLKKNLQIV